MNLPRRVAACALALLRFLLAGYPPAFRRRFGAEIVRDARQDLEAAAARGTAAVLRTACRALASAGRDLVAERRSSRRGWLPPARTLVSEGSSMFRGLAPDVRLAARRLRTQPLLALAVIVTLGLAVGASTSIFSVADAALLKPLPFPEGHQLVLLEERTATASRNAVSLPAVDIWEREAPSLAAVAFFEPGTSLTLVNGEPELLARAMVSRSFFDVLRVAPLTGNSFSPAPRIGPPDEAVISYHLWQRLGGRREVIGTTITVDPGTYRIVGVMPPDFSYPADAQVWTTPTKDWEKIVSIRELRFVQAVGRLRPDASLQSLHEELAVLTARYPSQDRIGGEVRMAASDLRESMVGHVRAGMVAVGWAVGLLLVIACCNVTALLLGSAVGRQREMAVQTALGASRGRLLRQGGAEVLLLALPACALGILLAWTGRDAIVALSFDEIPRIGSMAVDQRALAFAMAATLLCAALATLVPAWGVGCVHAAAGLRGGSRDGGASPRVLRALRILLVAQVALTFVVTTAGVLLGRTLYRLSQVDTGFTGTNTLAMRINLPLVPRLSPPAQRAFYDDLMRRVEAVPGVESASYVGRLPLSRVVPHAEAHPVGEPSREARVVHTPVGAGYFATVGAQIVEGREISADDHVSGPAAVVNEVLARQLFPDGDAVGRRVVFQEMLGPIDARIVGVVRPVRYNGLTSDLVPEIFLDYRVRSLRQWLVVRTDGPVMALVPSLEAAVRQADPTNRVTADPVTTLEREVSRELARPQFFLVLAGTFALVALSLAALGLYGVMAFAVAQRRHEIGVRLALGATPSRLFASVMASGAILAGIGLVIGIFGAAGAVRAMRALLFGVQPLDPLTFAASTTLVVVVALAACWAPARRARTTDPLTVLRTD